MRVALLLLLASLTSTPCQEVTFTNLTLTFTNLHGDKFSNVQLIRADKVGLIWRNETGGGRVAYSNLAPWMLTVCGLPTNYFEIQQARQEAWNKQQETARLYNEQLRRESIDRVTGRYFDFHAIYVWEISEFDFPKTPEAVDNCKQVLSELKQMDKALELGVNYERFSDILQNKAMAIEKLKDASSDGSRASFMRHADGCLHEWSTAKHWWLEKIKAKTGSSSEALVDYYFHKYLSYADLELLCCKAIVERDSNNRIAFEKVGGIILMQQEALRTGVLPRENETVLPQMTVEEVVSKLKKSKETLATKGSSL